MSSTDIPRSQDVDVEKNIGSVLTPPPITLSWHDLTLELNGNTILSGVSGQLGSGQMLAVMGPSGAFLVVMLGPLLINFD
jgi:ABC-type transporter Mla maintaining outer membrane lipid asymmetry ATPase subunit MlaF